MEAVAKQKRTTKRQIAELSPQIKSLFESGNSREKIASTLSICPKVVSRVIKSNARFDWLPADDEAQFTPEHVPTPEEIRLETLQFQLGWSKAETMRRQGGHLGDN
ncbi:MAG: hypothetical protein ACTHK7_15025 [Aureliella sp.]